MFRFSVLLAFLFAYFFGPTKATPLKKKAIRRRIAPHKPVIANGLKAMDTNLMLDEVAIRHGGDSSDSSDSDSSDSDGGKKRRRPHKRRRRCKHCKSHKCRRKCRRKGKGKRSGSDSDSSDSDSD